MTDAQPADQLVAAVYRERAHLVAALTKHYPAGWRDDPHSPGWVAYVDLPTGQVSWHISPADMDVFPDLPVYPGEWDYHSTEEKYRRLDALPIARAMAELVAAVERYVDGAGYDVDENGLASALAAYRAALEAK